ncbi:MAG: hypothetical protein HRT89_10870 [Lentisphaeria bacterium]|nr:hypothetical protein [Lentisphaeria bacterium]NQZ68557.1 hypothetical protein [Lentisphaeria bacterium]
MTKKLTILFLLYFTSASAADFSDSIYAALLNELYRQAAIDPVTGLELKDERRRMQRQHEKLALWYKKKNDFISSKNCRSPECKKIWTSYKKEMANEKLLYVSAKKRLKFCKEIAAHYKLVNKTFDASIKNLTNDAEVRKLFKKRLKQTLHFRFRYFQRSQTSQTAAVYFPALQVIAINLDIAYKNTGNFIDSFAHEFWHHLLPVSESRLAESFFIEGQTELLADEWNNSFKGVKPGTIEYPLQTAWVSLLYSIEKEKYLRYLCSIIPKKTLANIEYKDGFSNHVISVFKNSQLCPPKKKQRLEELLANWGWKEDDKSPLKLDVHLEKGLFSKEKMLRLFKRKRQLYMDLANAIAVINLQDLHAKFTKDEILERLKVNNGLKANMSKLLDYCKNPKKEYNVKYFYE